MQLFKSIITELVENNNMVDVGSTDSLVAKEMNNMVNKSMECTHTPSRRDKAFPCPLRSVELLSTSPVS